MSITSVAVSLAAVIALSSCQRVPEVTALSWDLAKTRDVTALRGGRWTPTSPGLSPNSYTYYVHAKNKRVTIRISDQSLYTFEDAIHLYAKRNASQVTLVEVATAPFTQAEAIRRLQGMHERWNGPGVGKIDKWIDKTRKGSMSRYETVIRMSDDKASPTITAAICYSSNPEKKWFIMWTVFWPQ